MGVKECVCMSVSTCECVSAHMRVCVSAHMRVCVSAHVRECMYVSGVLPTKTRRRKRTWRSTSWKVTLDIFTADQTPQKQHAIGSNPAQAAARCPLEYPT